MYKEAVEAIAAIATVVSIVILVWDRMSQKPDFNMSYLGPQPMTRRFYFRIENKGREEAPGAYIEYVIRRLRDGLKTREKERLYQWVPDEADPKRQMVPEHDLKVGGYTEVYLSDTEDFKQVDCMYGFLTFDVYAVKANERFRFLFRRHNESIRIWSGILVDPLYWVCFCAWLLLNIKTNLIKIMRRMIRIRE